MFIIQSGLKGAETGIIKRLILFLIVLFHGTENEMRLSFELKFVLDLRHVFHVGDVDIGGDQQQYRDQHRIQKRVFKRVAIIVQ